MVFCNKHVESAHEFACEQCDYKATSKTLLKTHTDRDHEFTCEKCDYKSSTKIQLKSHSDTAHKNKRIACDYCERKFNKKETYEKHMKQDHAGRQNYMNNENSQNLIQTTLPFQRILRSHKKAVSTLEPIN